MSALEFMWDAAQSGQIRELQELAEEQAKTLQEMKVVLHNMALRIRRLEGDDYGKCEEGDSNSLSPMVETPSRLETSVLEDRATSSEERPKES